LDITGNESVAIRVVGKWLLYEDAAEMTEYVSHALSDAAKEAEMLL
jgi:hypothetical protein